MTMKRRIAASALALGCAGTPALAQQQGGGGSGTIPPGLSLVWLPSYNNLFFQGGNLTATGTENVAVGPNAGASITAPVGGGSIGNTLVGFDAGTALTTAEGVVAVGAYALYSYTGTGAGVEDGIITAVGGNAGYSTIPGALDDVFVGWKAGAANTTGGSNTVIGSHAEANGTTTIGNSVVIGADAGQFDAASGSGGNTLIGTNVAEYNSGSGNVVVGFGAGNAGSSTATGLSTSNATIVGSAAGGALTSGANAALFGYQAGAAITTGGNNTAIGYEALNGVGTNGNDTALGANAGSSVTGGNDICIGFASCGNVTSQSNLFVAGSSNSAASDVYFGKGYADPSPTAYTLHGTGGSGSNVAGAALTLAGGSGTGTGASGAINFDYAAAGASGSTPNTLSVAVHISTTGHLIYDNVEAVTPGTAACFNASDELGSDAANCIASKLGWKDIVAPIQEPDARETIAKFAKDAIYYRYTDKFLGAAAANSHARDVQPGFGAEWIARDDPRYAIYDKSGAPSGVRYEQLTAALTVEVAALMDCKLAVLGHCWIK